ncbi:MAG: hypothetical protein PHY59_09705 [Methanobacterium sp.]|nr:hypothetical protein [Methanobacterium sp.]
MGDYTVKLSYSLNDAVKEFLGELTLRGTCGVVLTGKVYDNGNPLIGGEVWGIMHYGKLNFLKRPLNDELVPVKQFQVFRENGGEDFILGKYGGGWKERRDISHNSNFSDFFWLSNALRSEIWRTPARTVSMEILHSPRNGKTNNLNTLSSL